MIDNHTPVEPGKFGGLYARGTYDDNVPRDHFIDSLNTIGAGSQEIKTRAGFDKSITLANLRRTRRYQKEGEATRILALDSTGKLFDCSVSLVTPILNIATMTDFSLVVLYNRAYISPNNGVTGLPSEYVYVYDGDGTTRRAAGAAPIGGFTIAVSATAGNIEVGTHLFGWCYETDSGFVTAPGEIQALELDGTKAVDFTNIPAGPAGTSARRLIASRAIQDYNGNTEAYEMFFVSGGRIADNTTLNLSSISFFDADLQLSADYTFDQLDSIPAGLFLGSYDSRMVVGAESANHSMVRISKSTEPESISELSGFLVLDPTETEGVKACVEYRKNLYITKGNPGKTYATSNNGYDPSTWDAPAIDGGIGADYNGISTFVSPHAESTAIAFFTADISGIFMFDGAYRDIPLTFKIQTLWDRINPLYFNKTQLIINSKRKLMYVLVALDSATTPNYILVGDFSEGLDAKNIVWHIWNYTNISPVSILLDINSSTKGTLFKVAGYAGNVYVENPVSTNDDGVLYTSFIKSGLANLLEGYIHHCAAVRLRVRGSGNLLVYLYGEDAVLSSQLPTVTLASAPGKEFLLPANFTNEKVSLKLSCTAINEYFQLYNAVFYLQAVWATRPL